MINQVLCEYLDHFIMIFIDDILFYSLSEEEHRYYRGSGKSNYTPSSVSVRFDWSIRSYGVGRQYFNRTGQDYSSYGLAEADSSNRNMKFSRTCSLL